VPEPRYYNGFRAGEDVVGPADPADGGSVGVFEAVSTAVARRLGIENVAAAAVQGRGVMIDLNAHLGREHVAVGHDLLMQIMEKDGVVVETGDMVCLHTGFAAMLMEMDGDPDPHLAHNSCTALDGRDPRLLDWITASGLSVIASDNFAVERFPATSRPKGAAAAPLHEHCLFKQGIHLGELWNLSPLAGWLRDNGRSRFFLTAPPLRLTGATGSPVTPIATV